MEHSKKIYGKIAASRNLPSPPQVLLKLLDACCNRKVSPAELADIVFKDPSISSKILQLINSSFMGLREKIDDLEKAVIYLGADTIKNIAISASVFQVFRRTEGSDQFNLQHFWWHSVMCGTLAKRIAKKTGYSSTDEAFLSGMLHDIGKLVLWVNFKKKYAAALLEAGDDAALLMSKEREIGAAHHELGAWLVRQWRLDSLMADAILYHHDHLERIAGAFPLVKIVFLANMLSREDTGNGEKVLEVARALFDMDDTQVRDILDGARDEVADVARSLGVPANPPETETSEAPEPSETPEKSETRQETDPSQKRLEAAVKHLSLMYGTLQNLLKAASREEILKTATNGFQILFGIPRFFFFLHDPENDVLKNHASIGITGNGVQGNMALPCAGRQSLLVRCFALGEKFDSFDAPGNFSLSIADEQILRLLGTEGMLCLPLTADSESVGIVVAGTSAAQSRNISRQQSLLDLFTHQVGMCLYVHEIKEAQAGLIRTERLEASATVARKVVHEVNNPLGIIKNYLKILGLKLPEKHPAQAELSIISEEIDRVGQIIGGLKDYATPKVSALEPVNINQLLKNILAIADSSILKPAMIQLHFSPDPAIPVIRTGKNGLKQVFINLVKNAAEAMLKGGNIHIDTKFHAASSPESDNIGNQSGTIDIFIRDDGPGIPEEVKRHLFEPLHSSKKEGHSGLGLSIVRNIIKELGGNIACETSPRAGTTFTITLPAAPEKFTNDLGG